MEEMIVLIIASKINFIMKTKFEYKSHLFYLESGWLITYGFDKQKYGNDRRNDTAKRWKKC